MYKVTKNSVQKYPPPKFLHKNAKILKIVAYMQKKGVFLHIYEHLKSRENFKTENFTVYSHCSIFGFSKVFLL